MTAPMMESCDALHAYVDGELEADEATAFEAHLVSCDACNDELPRLLALLTALDAAAAHRAAMPQGTQRLAVLPGGLADAAPARVGPRAAERRSWRRAPWLGACVVALAAAAVVVVVLRPRPVPAVASIDRELGPRRTIDVRLSYPGADRYRELDVARGARSHENISMTRMAELEAARDWHGAGVAALLAGDSARSARWLAQAAASPALESDRAALDLLDGSPEAIDRALAEADRALAAAPNHGPALWNHALVLASLNLPLTAAADFDQVAALGEPGWASEARTRAAALRAEVVPRRVRWKRVLAARKHLLEDGTPVPRELLAIPGYMTIAFYDAVRAAGSRSAVEALLPMAQALDGAYRSDRLTTYARRIAASDFRIRKPFADTYRQLVLHQPMTPAAIDRFLAQLARAGIDDILLGALVRTDKVATRLDDYRRLAAATGDPWFLTIAEHETAKAEIARGDQPAAEHRLIDAIALAGREHLTYRSVLIDQELVALYRFKRDLLRAHREAQKAYRDTASAGETVLELDALIELAAINQDRYAHDLARAYLAEILAWTETTEVSGPSPFDADHDCSTRRYAYESLANVSLNLANPARARAEVAHAPPSCPDGPTVLGAVVRTELYSYDHREADAAFARDSFAFQRALPELAPADRAMLTHLEGTLVLERDRAAGERLLRQAIAEAADDPAPNAVKARAYSFSLLAVAAGRASEFGAAIAVLAEALGVARPARCALAIAVEGRRSVVALSDASGHTSGAYVETRTPGEVDIPSLVPEAIVRQARTCERVVVLARAPVLGAARLLPPYLAWSYLIKGARAAPPPGPVRQLVIANPDPPPDLNLPALTPFPDAPAAGVQLLRGADATPTRVLLAMRDASVIEFHTHGYIANDVSEASYLVLSPEVDRQYAMTARDVARVKLEASPLVILGACHAAASSRSLEGGTGLAEAFLRSGARAVVASPDAVQDLGAYAFFTAVRNRVIGGADVATALRDERVQRRTSSRDDAWTSGVVVFE
jgi:hypothetical protein